MSSRLHRRPSRRLTLMIDGSGAGKRLASEIDFANGIAPVLEPGELTVEDVAEIVPGRPGPAINDAVEHGTDGEGTQRHVHIACGAPSGSETDAERKPGLDHW